MGYDQCATAQNDKLDEDTTYRDHNHNPSKSRVHIPHNKKKKHKKSGNNLNELLHLQSIDNNERSDLMDNDKMLELLLNKIDDSRKEIKDDIRSAELRTDKRLDGIDNRLGSLERKTIEQYKFWIGISIPAIISICGIIATIIIAK